MTDTEPSEGDKTTTTPRRGPGKPDAVCTYMDPDPPFISPDDTIQTAVQRMLEAGSQEVYVVGADQELLGTVTEKTLLLAALSPTLGHNLSVSEIGTGLKLAARRKAREVMGSVLKPVASNDSAYGTLREMLRYDVEDLPVVENGKLMGVLRRRRLFVEVARYLGTPVRTPRPSLDREA